jgi:hypothetical protein
MRTVPAMQKCSALWFVPLFLASYSSKQVPPMDFNTPAPPAVTSPA